MKTQEKKEQPVAPINNSAETSVKAETKMEHPMAYALKGKALQPFAIDAGISAIIAQDKQSLEKKFKTEKELAELVLNNGKVLFGEQNLTIDYKNKIKVGFPGGFLPQGLLFDLKEPAKPRLYIIEAMLADQNLATLILKITCNFSFFKKGENTDNLAQVLGRAIQKNIGWRNQLKPVLGSRVIYEFLQELMRKPPAILLIMDSFKHELKGFMETYTETWGRFVKPVLFRKFSTKDGTIFTMNPTFAELSSKAVKERIVKSTEADHLENVSEMVKDAFRQIKAELLKGDKEIEFRVKQYYISLRKNRNLAFFQLGKKKLSIVVMNPEKDTRRQIKHHTVKTLAESVQKFWNGECCTVVVESNEHLGEITCLLKKLVGGGKGKAIK